MFVCGNGIAKSDVTQVLQSVGQRIVPRVPVLPQAVSRGEFLWRKGGKPQQVVRSIFDHIDSQVISCIDAEVWPLCIPKSKSFQFQNPVEG